MYKVYRALRNGGETVSEFEEIDDMIQDVLKNPNHIFAIKEISLDGLQESDVRFASVAGFLDFWEKNSQ